MNNIYKVIWSKAKNCYVVASEIARSHTKSASGSEKIGGVTRRSLLASLMALSLLCGGLGVASASLEVVDQSGTAGTVTIYTKDEVDNALTAKGSATDVASNTTDITNLKNAVGDAGSGLTKEVADQKAAITANTTSIDTNKAAIESLRDDKLDKALANSTFATKDALNDLTTTVNGKADEAAVATALDGKANKADTLAGYGITDAYTKGDVDDKLNAKADAANVFTKDQTYTRDQVNTKLADYAKSADVYTKTDADAKFATSGALTTAKTELDQKIDNEIANRITSDTALDQKIDNEIANLITSDTALDQKIDNEIANRITSDTALDQKIDKEIQDRENAIKDTNDRTGGIARNTEKTQTTIEGIVKVDNQGNVKDVKGLAAETITTSGNADLKGNVILGTNTANTVTVNGNADFNEAVNMDKGLTVTSGDTTLKGTKVDGKLTVTDDADLKNTKVDGTLTTTGKATFQEAVEMDKGLTVTSGDTTLKGTKVDGKLTVTDEADLKNTKVDGTLTTTGKATFQEAVEMDKGLTVTSGDTTLKGTKVDGKLTVTDEADLKNTKVDGTLGVTGATTLSGELTAEKNATFEKDVTVKGTTNLKDTTVDGDLKVTGTITTDKMIFGDKATNNYTEIDHGKVTSKNLVVNGAGETISSSSTFNAKENKVGFANSATGEQSSHKQTSDMIVDNVKNNITGDQSFHKQTSDVIMDNVKDLHNSNNRTQTKTETKDIITDKDGNSSTTSQTASENKTYLKDKDGKNTNSTIDTAKGYDKTIKGENGETSTKQDELNITNTAQNGTITNDAQNIVNNASGNITNKANTMDTNVTGKATESYGSLDTTVNGNETHIVKGTKTETVDGMVTENYKAGQATNVTGDQTTNVSGTQTTTATDINRNASSGMIDTIDNDYGTNTETKVAGKTTTDVSIKGTGEKGQYIRGANESRDYLIKGTLTNTETKTAEATSTEITDGTNKASTRQDAKNLAGSVTNGTETGVSGIHANDDGSVSIDSAVAGGGMSSVINQKKDSIQSAVGDGTNSTVIHQDKDNVTIASSNGTVGIVGKDIVNNAQNTITNTAGTSITNQVKDSKVTTDVDGTTFENKTAAVSDGGTTTTKINGNQITTGRVNANELGVSDKDGANTADFSVEAGEGKGVKASAGNGTTTGSLDVTADEVVSSVKDASGKGSTFKQRIDAIMMESKDVSIKAEETLTNEAKVITNKASEVINNEAININNTATGIIKSKASEIQNQADRLISNKVGENTWENMEDGKITTSIKNGTKQNLTQSDAEKTEHSVVNGSNSTVNKQTSEEITDAVTNGTTTNVTQNTATSSNNTIADKNGNANTVISTADGTSFINSKAAAPVTGASGDGTEVKTTIKGNTITTGKVTMDYADVMKDLGVRGNANITGKTTTGSLEVTGTSTLTGDVTMGSNATVNGNFNVKGDTNLKNTKVDGTLNVTQKATFDDSVSIAKDLSVDGNATIKGDVTANSYKVGDKTYISAAGINANDQKITNVADGSISEGSKDAVNGGQLYTVKNDLEGKVNKVGANAAAMANLHPMEFDPDSKWNIAAAIGNYGSETAAALGAFYRPNDDVMVNLSTAFGTGENMVGGGVSVRLGKGGNKLSREETNALKAQVADLTARMDALLSVLNPNMSKDFPDVPENHWAYEAVSRLAGNDIVQGYPDGEFHGERTMTRYEMAEIIYNALSRGAEAERKLVEEFKPELQAMAASEKATAEKAEG